MQDQLSMRQACCFKQTIRVGFIHCLPLLENTLVLVPKGFGFLFKSITDNYKFENILLNGAELEASLAPKLMICVCNFFCKLRTAFALIKFAFWEQLQNAGPLLNIHQTSRLVWLGSGRKNEE